MDKDFEKIFALKPIVPDTGQRNTRVFKKKTVEIMKKLAEKQKKENKKTLKTSNKCLISQDFLYIFILWKEKN